MQIALRYRLFLVLLTATGIVALGMVVIMQWSLDRGFLQYVNTLEEERVERLAAELERTYAREGSWDFLRDRPGALLRVLRQAFPERGERIGRLERQLSRGDDDPRLPSRRRPEPKEPLPPHLANRFEFRLRLLDAERHALLGPERKEQEVALTPLTVDGETIGFIGLLPKRRLSEAPQLRFIRQQKIAFVLVAALMLTVSALLALPLAKRLVRPIRALADGTRRLAAGAYETRVAVTSNDELGQLARDFNALALVLSENEKSRRQWMADISHELRTPLAVLRAEIEALQDGVRPQTPEALASLHAEVLQLGRLVDDLHQLSLCDLGGLAYRKEPLDLAEVAEEVLAALATPFAGKNIAVEADLPVRGIALVYGDRTRLTQLMTNLLDNSLKYTDAGGRLVLRLARAGQRVVIDLQDSTPAVSTADLERLFERLYRVEASRNRATGGAGLGLSICRSIVEAHEGTVGADHSPLGGLKVTISLPAMEVAG